MGGSALLERRQMELRHVQRQVPQPCRPVLAGPGAHTDTSWLLAPVSMVVGCLTDLCAFLSCWCEQLLSLIGEQFSEPSEICGGVVNIRVKGDRLALWTRTASKEQEQVLSRSLPHSY